MMETVGKRDVPGYACFDGTHAHVLIGVITTQLSSTRYMTRRHWMMLEAGKPARFSTFDEFFSLSIV